MPSRIQSGLSVALVLTVIAILVAGAALVQVLLAGDDGVPRTAAERTVVSAEESVRTNPDDPVARVRLAAAYLEQGSPSRAIEQAEIALQLNPEMPDAHFVLGMAHLRQGDTDAAIARLTTAGATEGQFAPFYQEVFVALARAYEEAGDVDAAVGAYDDALSFGPENALIILERGQMFERQERWLEAAYDFGMTLVFVPDMQEAIDGLSRIEQGHPEEYAEAMEAVERMQQQMGTHSSGMPEDGAADEDAAGE